MHIVGMKLSDYIAAQGLTDAEFGKLVNLSSQSINRIKHGRQTPSLRVAMAICDVTGGTVTASDLQAATEVAA
jgi:DNA-binding XRE family transcriptional regulator